MPFKFSKAAKAMGFRKPVGSKLKKTVKRIVRQIVPKPEKKFFTVTNSDASIDVGGVIAHLSGIAQGDDVSNRTGNDITGDYIDLRISLGNNEAEAASGASALLRVMVFQDTQQDNTDPTVLEVLQTANPLSQLNVDNVGRFKILFDHTCTLNSLVNAQSATGTGLPVPIRKYVHCYRKLKGKSAKIEFTGANATDVHNNNLYILFITDVDELGAIVYSSRLGYYDN